MAKIHLLMKKEDIDESKMDADKIAVVFDVLLATSTITSAIHFGAREVIPVLNEQEARTEAETQEEGSYLMVGEYEGKTIDGFLDPNPLALKEQVQHKSVILSTTNGTVATRKSASANKVYVASLLNGDATADRLLQSNGGETIVLVCSGSSGEFCMEDFFGAGYFLECLVKRAGHELDLTDAAKAAHLFYIANRDRAEEVLLASRVGEMIVRYGFEDELKFVSNQGILPVTCRLVDGKRVVREEA